MTKQSELFPELGPQQLQPTGRVTFELVPDTSTNDCAGCAFEYVSECHMIPGIDCTMTTIYRLVEASQC